MKRQFSVATVLGVMVFAAGMSRAQMGMGRGSSVVMLLNHREVQKELKMKPDQVKRLQQKLQEMGGAAKNQDPSTMGNALAMMASTDAAEKWVSDILDPDQVKRLHELLLQHEGPTMLAEPSVAKDLDLTAEQKTRVSGIVEKSDADQQALMMDLRKINIITGAGVNGVRKKSHDLKKATAESLMAVLTPPQTSKWGSIQGAKFKFPKTADNGF